MSPASARERPFLQDCGGSVPIHSHHDIEGADFEFESLYRDSMMRLGV